jgi:hypothetical protein
MRRALLLALLLLPTGARPAEAPVRDGFTLELGIGLGLMHVFPDEDETTSDAGMTPMSISLGGFLNNSMAIMFRSAGVANLEEVSAERILSFLLFYGVHFQYWITDQFFVSAGPGLAILGSAHADDFFDTLDRERGFGLSLRGGFSFANWQNHSLRVTLELFPSFFKHATAMGEALTFEWQWF